MQTPIHWHVNERGLLERSWVFPDFDSAFALATQIALLAAAQDHHPDLEIKWGSLRCSMISHDVGRLTERDERLALAINSKALATTMKASKS